jgi:hypothetical protein
MKPVKKSVFAVLLLSVLALKTFAGDIQTPGAAAPPPPPPTSVVITSTAETTQPSTDPVQSGETVESDYFLFEALAALFLY